MKRLPALSILLTVCWCIGCAPRDNPSPSYIPPWDSPIPSDYTPEERSPLDNLPSLLSESERGFHFRETRWGFSPERVKLSEVGRRPDESTREMLVYTYKINEVKCKLIYTFKDNKLRTAGYLTTEPIKNAENLIKIVTDEHDVPISSENGMVWESTNSVIWTNSYASVIKNSLTRYKYTKGGLFSDMLSKELSQREKAGEIVYFDGVIGYFDKAFYKSLLQMQSPSELLSELSSYEQQLMGIIERRGRTIIPGLEEIPH